MKIPSFFTYCPWCRSQRISLQDNKCFVCKNCHREYFHNVATAAGALLRYKDKLVLINRNREPAKGKLHIPGGFVDPEETAEEAVRREVAEELYLHLEEIRYYSSFPNLYEYRGVVYFTCDLIYLATITSLPEKFCKEEVAAVLALHPREIELPSLAFPSTAAIITAYSRDQHLWQA